MRKQHPAIVALDTLAGFRSNRAVLVARRRLVESALRLFIPEPANPEDEVVRNASDRELIAAPRALNLRERQAIYLRYYEDEPFAQIGDILGVREGTARVIVSRALDKMRRRLNSSEEMTEVLA